MIRVANFFVTQHNNIRKLTVAAAVSQLGESGKIELFQYLGNRTANCYEKFVVTCTRRVKMNINSSKFSPVAFIPLVLH
jgi:hypothetical protein